MILAKPLQLPTTAPNTKPSYEAIKGHLYGALQSLIITRILNNRSPTYDKVTPQLPTKSVFDATLFPASRLAVAQTPLTFVQDDQL